MFWLFDLFNFSLEVTLNFFFVFLFAVHFPFIIAFTIWNFRRIVIHEVYAHYLGWWSCVNWQERWLVGTGVTNLVPVVERLVFCQARLLVLKFVWVYWHLRQLLLLTKEVWVSLGGCLFRLLDNWVPHQTDVVKGNHTCNALLFKLRRATKPVLWCLFFYLRPSRLSLFVKQLSTLQLYLPLVRRYAVL